MNSGEYLYRTADAAKRLSSRKPLAGCVQMYSIAIRAIRDDLNSLKDTLSRFMSQASDEALKSARQLTSNVAGQVSDVASDLANRGSQLASSAGDQAKTFANELEGMARRNPLGALAGAVAIGVLIGVMGRRS